MPTPRKPQGNSRTLGSAAAFTGVIGVPDPGRGPQFGDGGLKQFCTTFNRRFDEWAAGHSPEMRSFARNERYFAATLR